jgi:chemotaxis protein MotB
MARRTRRRKQHGGHEDSERWMVTYADMITLLLVFFIILYSMSSLQLDRFNALVQSLKTAFQGNAIVNQSMNPPTTNYSIPMETDNQIKKTTESQKDKQKLDKLYTQLENYIKQNHLESDVELENMTTGVQVTVKDHILFDLGKANIKPDAEPILKKLGGILTVVDNHIRVEGYTDNHPIGSGSPFASNWDLSGARAENVMLYLINVDKIKPERMSFVGFGEYAPRVPNDTEAHKAMNRRVNIVIERNATPAN